MLLTNKLDDWQQYYHKSAKWASNKAKLKDRLATENYVREVCSFSAINLCIWSPDRPIFINHIKGFHKCIHNVLKSLHLLAIMSFLPDKWWLWNQLPCTSGIWRSRWVGITRQYWFSVWLKIQYMAGHSSPVRAQLNRWRNTWQFKCGWNQQTGDLNRMTEKQADDHLALINAINTDSFARIRQH